MKCFLFPLEEAEGLGHGGTVVGRLLSTSSSLCRASLTRPLNNHASGIGARSLRRSSEFELNEEDDSLVLPGFPSAFHDSLSPRAFSFPELEAATRGFSRSRLIGEGGFGCVYRGSVKIPFSADALDVAVKKLNRGGFQGHKEWVNEVNWLGVIKHPNLVKLIGYCADDDERGIQRLLVYELMKNKSLEDHLLPSRFNFLNRKSSLPQPLSWMIRIKIARDAARGLAYLHEEIKQFQLIFRDFKSSNVLLDEEFNAKLSDFGLARMGPPDGVGYVSTSVVGTMGYAAPEYLQAGKLTAKSDVWSFGVVLFELITGRRAVDRNLPRGEQDLLEWIKPYLSNAKRFHLVVDHRLDGKYCIKSVQRVASLASKCVTKNSKSRPKMSEVVGILESIILATLYTEPTLCRSVSNVDIVVEDEGRSEMLRKEGNLRKKYDIFREMGNLRKIPRANICGRMKTFLNGY